MKKIVNKLKNYFNTPLRRIIFSLSLMPLLIALFFSMLGIIPEGDFSVYGFFGFLFIWILYFLAMLAIGKDALSNEINKTKFKELFFFIFKLVLIVIIFGVIFCVIYDCLPSVV